MMGYPGQKQNFLLSKNQNCDSSVSMSEGTFSRLYAQTAMFMFHKQATCFQTLTREGEGQNPNLPSTPLGDPILPVSLSSCTPQSQAACWWEWKTHNLSSNRSKESDSTKNDRWKEKQKFHLSELLGLLLWWWAPPSSVALNLLSWFAAFPMCQWYFFLFHIFPCSSHIPGVCSRRPLCFWADIPLRNMKMSWFFMRRVEPGLRQRDLMPFNGISRKF